jgi:hypothetical protein
MDPLIADPENWAIDKSVRNMLEFFSADLLGLIKGRIIVDVIPFGTRKRFVEHGILRKFGSKFELTERGRQLLIVVPIDAG